MHELIRNGLESFIADKGRGDGSSEFDEHLRQCCECREEAETMLNQSLMLHLLRPDAEVEPGRGFYGKVLARIESQARPSIWSVFLDPHFGKRLVYASMTAVLLITTYLVATEPSAADLTDDSRQILADDKPGLGADQQADREAILVDFASF